MPNTLRLKRSAVASKVPVVGDLQLGELAINTFDGKLFLKKDNGTASIVEIGAGGGGASVTISDTAPASPTAGNLWWRSSEGQLYIYYNDGNTSQWVIANAFVGGSAYLPLTGGTVSGDIIMSGTGQLELPAGTTAQRSGSPAAGMLRYNTTLGKFEGYSTAWGSLGGGATGGGSDAVFYENGKTVTTNYTITSNTNAMSTGPITINAGVTVTVPSGSRWVIL